MAAPASLTSKLWIDAHIRFCFLNDYPAFVINRGDAERGGILLKIDRFDQGILIYERAVSFEGHTVWRPKGSDDGLSAEEANSLIDKRLRFDPDCWVLEIEDIKGTYSLNEPIENI